MIDEAIKAADPDYWPTTYIAVVPTLSGITSAISSAVIVYLIFRSAARLSTIYHRIMFCMSICDIIGSIGYALTSLPMPAVMPLEEEFGIMPGPRHGNTVTCDVQGFLASFGPVGMFGYNVALCFYYACAIGFEVSDRNIHRFVQPVVLGLPIIGGLMTSIIPLVLGLFNPPTTLSTAWCHVQPYPYSCLTDDNVSCIRGQASQVLSVYRMFSMLIITGLVVICLSMILVISRAVYLGRLIRLASRHEAEGATSNPHDGLSLPGRMRKQVNIRALIVQAMAYIAVFTVGLSWNVIPRNTYEQQLANFKSGLFFLPIQGFFNMLIFISHKIYNYLQVDDNKTVFEVLKLLFTSSIQEPRFISGISMVNDDTEIPIQHKIPALGTGFGNTPKESRSQYREEGGKSWEDHIGSRENPQDQQTVPRNKDADEECGQGLRSEDLNSFGDNIGSSARDLSGFSSMDSIGCDSNQRSGADDSIFDSSLFSTPVR